MKRQEAMRREFNAKKEGVRIVRVAAFCFAIVSFMATAKGLEEYVFTNAKWQSLLISFGIQSILFVLNLKLPEYFKHIGEVSAIGKRKHRHYHLGKMRGTEKPTYRWTLAQRAMLIFYAVFIGMSSLFSFVYICDYVVYHHLSGYSDDNTILSSLYGTVMRETEEYVLEDLKAVRLTASFQLGELQKEFLASSSKSKQLDLASLKEREDQAKKEFEKAKTNQENCQRAFSEAQKRIGEIYDVRFYEWETYQQMLDSLQNAQNNLDDSTIRLDDTKHAYEDAQSELNAGENSFEVLGANLLSELLKENIETEKLESLVDDLKTSVMDLREGGMIPDNYSDLVMQTQSLSITVKNYKALNEILEGEEGLELLKSEYSVGVPAPDPQSSSFLEERREWRNAWTDRYESLLGVVRRLPAYHTNQFDETLWTSQVNVPVLQQYNIQEKEDDIQDMIRYKLSDINILVRAFKLLSGKYRGSAWFSFLLASFFDISSLLAGLFAYYVKDIGRKEKPQETSEKQ